jgi:hypothetical protein
MSAIKSRGALPKYIKGGGQSNRRDPQIETKAGAMAVKKAVKLGIVAMIVPITGAA